MEAVHGQHRRRGGHWSDEASVWSNFMVCVKEGNSKKPIKPRGETKNGDRTCIPLFIDDAMLSPAAYIRYHYFLISLSVVNSARTFCTNSPRAGRWKCTTRKCPETKEGPQGLWKDPLGGWTFFQLFQFNAFLKKFFFNWHAKKS